MRWPTRLLLTFFSGISLLAVNGFASAASLPGPSTGIPASAQSADEPLTAQLGEVWGSVLVRANENSAFEPATLDQVLQVGAQVQTESNGKARLDFSTGTIVRVGPGTLFTLQPTEQDSNGTVIPLQLDAGKLWVVLRGGSLDVQTETGVASVTGSLMTVIYNQASGKIRIACIDGHCSLKNASGEVEIGAGQTAEARGPDEAPTSGFMTSQDCADWESTTGVGACSGTKREKDEEQQDAEHCGGFDNCGIGAGGGNGTGNEGNDKTTGKEKFAPK